MSKYLDDLATQLKGKDINAFTRECKANTNISKILKDQRETEKRITIKKDVERMLADI